MIDIVQKMLEDTEDEVITLERRIMDLIDLNTNLDGTILMRAIGRLMTRMTFLKMYQRHAYVFSGELLSQMEMLGNPNDRDEFETAVKFHKLVGTNITAKCDPADQERTRSLGQRAIQSLVEGVHCNCIGLCYNTLMPAPFIFVKNPNNNREFIPFALVVDAVADGVTEYIKEGDPNG